LSRGWYQWEGGRYKKKMKEGECSENISGKMRPAETIPGMGERRIKENDGRGEFNYDIL
jgi:hypothetical protein